MDIISVIASSVFLFLMAIAVWVKAFAVDNDGKRTASDYEFWFVSASITTAVAVVWTIVSAANVKETPMIS